MTRPVLAAAVLIVGLLVCARAARAEDFYVAPNGNDANPGSEAGPFATMQQAQKVAAPGDTVYFRGGMYSFASASAADAIVLNKSGQANKLIHYVAYTNELPVFDFSGMTAQARITGLRVTASFIHLKGLELKGVPQNITTQHESWGIYNTGSNNIYELLNLHDIMGPGLFLAQGGGNLVLNCDSHHNYDPKSSSGAGTNADGFGCHTGTGATGNVFRGCRAYFNSDDGYDFIQAQEAVVVENSWAWSNGYLPDTTMASGGDGNGFKAGGYGLPAQNLPSNPPSHTVRQCVAFSNRSSGFYANHHPVADHIYNNSAFRNAAANYNMLGLNGNVGILRNNVAYGGTALSNGSGIDEAKNSWNTGFMVSDADFESVSPKGMDGPREPDGSLPYVPFLRLKQGSDLIDTGEDVGLPYVGAFPDLGAYELGAATGSGGVPSPGAGAAGQSAPQPGSAGASGKASTPAGGRGASAGAAGADTAGSLSLDAANGGSGTANRNAGSAGDATRSMPNPISSHASDAGGCACQAAPSAVTDLTSAMLCVLALARTRLRRARRGSLGRFITTQPNPWVRVFGRV